MARPTLTAKAAAELLSLPAYEQLRIINEQKYPRREPNSFRTPFYQPSLVAISKFYRDNNDPKAIAVAKQSAANLKPDSKRSNNLRVLAAFESSIQYTRELEIRPKRGFQAQIDDIVIRLAPDFLVYERGKPKVLFYNCRTVAIPSALARSTIEVAHWILDENEAGIPIGAIEYVDLVEKRVHTTRRRRRSTVNRLRTNAQVIKVLWDSL